MKLFELLQSGEIAIQRACIGDTANTGQVRSLVIGPTVCNGTARGCHAAKSVSKMGQLVSDSILLHVRNVVAGVIDTPFFEIASDHLSVMVVRAIGLCECGNSNHQGKQRG